MESKRAIVKPHWSLSLADLRNAESASEEKSSDAFRPISLKCGVFEEGRGSSYVEMGRTKILVQIDGPRESPSAASSRGLLTVRIDNEELRIRAVMESALSSLVHLDKYPRAEFIVNVSILSSGGGELAAALLAASLALIHGHVQMHDVVLAAHAIILPNGSFVIDPPSPLQDDHTSVTAAFMPNLNQIVCADIRGVLNVEQSREAISYACKQAVRLYPVVRKAIVASFSA